MLELPARLQTYVRNLAQSQGFSIKRSPVLRETAYFDLVAPGLSLYVDAIK